MLYEDLCEYHPDIIAHTLLLGLSDFEIQMMSLKLTNKYLLNDEGVLALDRHCWALYGDLFLSDTMVTDYSAAQKLGAMSSSSFILKLDIVNSLSIVIQKNRAHNLSIIEAINASFPHVEFIDPQIITRKQPNWLTMVLDAVDIMTIADNYFSKNISEKA
jgi:hypothetical protein